MPRRARISVSIASIRLGIGAALMVVAQQMQHAVNHQMGRMIRRRLALLPRFPQHRLPRQDHIAQRAGLAGRGRRSNLGRTEGQHVGRLVLAAIAAVQCPQRRVVAEGQRQFAGRFPEAPPLRRRRASVQRRQRGAAWRDRRCHQLPAAIRGRRYARRFPHGRPSRFFPSYGFRPWGAPSVVLSRAS